MGSVPAFAKVSITEISLENIEVIAAGLIVITVN